MTQWNWLTGWCLAGWLVLAGGMGARAEERELIQDPGFRGGFHLLVPTPGKRVVYGDLRAEGATAAPVWDLAQWSSRFPLTPGALTSMGQGTWAVTNTAKVVRGGGMNADICLGVNASVEYAGRARQSGAEPWVHLLLQQDFEQPPSLGELTACRLKTEVRLRRSDLHRTPDYTRDRHAAQFFIYFIVGNRHEGAADYGRYYWFGVPVYDDRERRPAAYQARDFGETGRFIYTPAAERFARASVQDGEWVAFAADLLPLMRSGLAAGHAAGFLPGAADPADYRIAGVFIGWEVPGLFDVELQMRGLSCVAVRAGK